MVKGVKEECLKSFPFVCLKVLPGHPAEFSLCRNRFPAWRVGFSVNSGVPPCRRPHPTSQPPPTTSATSLEDEASATLRVRICAKRQVFIDEMEAAVALILLPIPDKATSTVKDRMAIHHQNDEAEAIVREPIAHRLDKWEQSLAPEERNILLALVALDPKEVVKWDAHPSWQCPAEMRRKLGTLSRWFQEISWGHYFHGLLRGVRIVELDTVRRIRSLISFPHSSKPLGLPVRCPPSSMNLGHRCLVPFSTLQVRVKSRFKKTNRIQVPYLGVKLFDKDDSCRSDLPSSDSNGGTSDRAKHPHRARSGSSKGMRCRRAADARAPAAAGLRGAGIGCADGGGAQWGWGAMLLSPECELAQCWLKV
ncbi:hypothetical protein B0H17DRAFT_1189951 [Mycena rosella]|uniref:Uncharacterized protein n=1 Tax=Mycena rosella TaxID=1033263 RepID=A0AAD7AXM4_MYCRO|nr:hypothetical protein B0H17DRAFT_1189951 [Mycena rosella]